MFRVGDLFNGQTGDVDLQQKDVNGKGTYFINSGVDNNGIKGKQINPQKYFLQIQSALIFGEMLIIVIFNIKLPEEASGWHGNGSPNGSRQRSKDC